MISCILLVDEWIKFQDTIIILIIHIVNVLNNIGCLLVCLGCIELQEDSVETLLATACLLQLNPVIKACCQFLVKQLHPSNCLGIRMFADTQGCTELFEHAHAYTTKHFMEVTRNQEFLLLSANEVAKLLESEDLSVPSEETIFHVRFITCSVIFF